MQALRTALTTIVTVICLGFVTMVGLLDYDGQTRRHFDPASPGVHTVYHDEGGVIEVYMNKYGKLRGEGKLLRIDGMCASACTYFLKTWPSERVCATENSRFGFHGTYLSGFDPKWTPIYHQEVAYPEWLNLLLAERFGFDGTKDVDQKKYPSGFLWLTRDDLRLQHCPA
jgi:hypothetical protein